MPGRRRTASSPSRTWMLSTPYSPGTMLSRSLSASATANLSARQMFLLCRCVRSALIEYHRGCTQPARHIGVPQNPRQPAEQLDGGVAAGPCHRDRSPYLLHAGGYHRDQQDQADGWSRVASDYVRAILCRLDRPNAADHYRFRHEEEIQRSRKDTYRAQQDSARQYERPERAGDSRRKDRHQADGDRESERRAQDQAEKPHQAQPVAPDLVGQQRQVYPPIAHDLSDGTEVDAADENAGRQDDEGHERQIRPSERQVEKRPPGPKCSGQSRDTPDAGRQQLQHVGVAQLGRQRRQLRLRGRGANGRRGSLRALAQCGLDRCDNLVGQRNAGPARHKQAYREGQDQDPPYTVYV